MRMMKVVPTRLKKRLPRSHRSPNGSPQSVPPREVPCVRVRVRVVGWRGRLYDVFAHDAHHLVMRACVGVTFLSRIISAECQVLRFEKKIQLCGVRVVGQVETDRLPFCIFLQRAPR